MLRLYDNIREKRIALGMSQEELGKLCGYTSRSSIAKIESGLVDIPLSKIEMFASALNTTPSDLLGEDWEMVENFSYQSDSYSALENYIGQKVYEKSSEYSLEPDEIDPEIAEYLDQLKNTPGMRTLFSAAKGVSKEDLEVAAEMIKRMKKESGYED